jgi:hypothetical protein
MMNIFSKLSSILFVLISLSSSAAFAGKTTLTDPASINFGSTLAYIAICEKNGFIPIGELSEMMWVGNQNFTAKTWAKITNQYQSSLHDKKQYSIAKDRWVAFRVNEKDCHNLAKILPTLKDGIIRFNR